MPPEVLLSAGVYFTERNGTERNGAERNGTERNGTQGYFTERKCDHGTIYLFNGYYIVLFTRNGYYIVLFTQNGYIIISINIKILTLNG